MEARYHKQNELMSPQSNREKTNVFYHSRQTTFSAESRQNVSIQQSTTYLVSRLIMSIFNTHFFFHLFLLTLNIYVSFACFSFSSTKQKYILHQLILRSRRINANINKTVRWQRFWIFAQNKTKLQRSRIRLMTFRNLFTSIPKP